MPTGKKTKNLQVFEGAGPMDNFSIADYAKASDFSFLTMEADNKKRVIGWYDGTEAIDESILSGLPKTTVIFDAQANKIKMKTSLETESVTFVDSAALT